MACASEPSTTVPRKIAVALYNRGRFSEGHMRRVFGYDAYHWGIIVVPEQTPGRNCWTFEATDATEIDPVTFRMNNPGMGWWFRDKDNADPELSSRLLCMIVLGDAPQGLSFTEIKALMTEVPLPIKDQNPQQSCVTWAENAVKTLQKQGWVRDFDVKRFKDWALTYADERLKDQTSGPPKLVQYSEA